MSEPNWGIIRSGECFEALVHALVFADDPKARLMDRPGKDKGVDALSGDGRTVFQAKFGQNLTMDDVVSRAEAEMAKIKRSRGNDDQTWRIVENWVLYANITINTWDAEKWQKFVQNFKRETGLSAECHNLALINQQLIDHPEIEQEFFEGRNRCLLYAQETYRTLEQQSFLSCFHKTGFVGRDADVRQVVEKLDATDTRIVLVTGHSGVGRTRFLYELFLKYSLDSVRAYWGLVESMEHSDSWYKSLNLGERAVIFVDDCNESVLALILNQLNVSGLDRIQYVISCSDESLCKVNQRIRRVDCTDQLELKPLSLDDMGKVVRSYEGVNNLSIEKVGGICHLSSGYPGWATFIMCAKVRHNHAKLMDVVGDVIEKSLEGIPLRLQSAAQKMLCWVALWGKVDFDGNDKDTIISFLDANGVPKDDWEVVVRHLCAVGVMKRTKLRGCVCRVSSKIMQHAVLLRWLIDIDAYSDGGALRLTDDGKKLIDILISGGLPLFSQALDVIAGVSIAHLPRGDAKTFASPILDDVASKIASATSISSLYEAYAFDVVWNIGLCDPLNALNILKAIKSSQSADCEINNEIYGKWTLTHSQVCSRVPTLAKNIAVNLDSEAIGEKYFDFILELWDDEEKNGIEFEEGYEPDKVVESLITSSDPGNIYHRIAFKFIKANFGKVVESEHLQKILSLLFVLRLSRAFVQMQRQFIMEHAYATPGTEPWAHWTELRKCVIEAIKNESDTIKRRVWWAILADAHRHLLNLADCPDDKCKTEEHADTYDKILKEDISIAFDYLTENEGKIPFAERVVMRRTWEFSIEKAVFNVPDEMYKMAMACEELYASGTEYNIQDVYKPESITHKGATANAIDKVVGLFLKPPNADFYAHFFDAAANYLKAVSSDPDVDYGRTVEIAIAVYEKAATKYKIGDGSLLDKYVAKVLSEYLSSSVIERKFVSASLRFYVKDLKKDNGVEQGFGIAWKALVELARTEENLRVIIADIFCKTNDQATGLFCKEELGKLLSLELDDKVFCDIIPAYYRIDEDLVLERLAKTIQNCDPSSDIKTLSRIMIHRFYIAAIQETISPNKKLMDWLMGLIIGKKIPQENIYSHQFGSLIELSKYKYPIRVLKDYFEAGFTFEHGFEIYKHFEVGNDKATYFELCDWVLQDGPNAFLRQYSLPGYLVALGVNGNALDEYIKAKCSEFAGQLKQLRRIALFAGCHKNDSAEWAVIASKVCTAAVSLSDEDKTSIYNALNPKIFMWHGVRGEVSPDIIHRVEVAKEHLANELADSPLRGYWEFEHSLAEGEYKRALADIEEEENG